MTKKFTLAALVAICIAAPAFADSHPMVTLGGHLDTYWGYVSEAEDFRKGNSDIDGPRRRDNALVSETKLIVRADGHLEHFHHMKYGGLIYLNADTSDDHYGDGYQAQQTMAYVEGHFGRLEAGSFTGASHALHVSATQIARGHSGIDGGGIDSDWWEWINPYGDEDFNLTTRVHTLVPQLYTNNIGIVGIKGVNASKITYFTPTCHGFQAGVTYLPDTESFGTVSEAMGIYKYDGQSTGMYRDIFEGGIHYSHKMHHFGFKAALVGQTGNQKNFFNPYVDGFEFQKLHAWEAGAAVRYMDWTVAGAYGSNGRAGQYIGHFLPSNRYWNVGVAYEHGPFGLSLTYATARSARAAFDNYPSYQFEVSRVHTFAVGADWRVTKGIKLYTDVVSFSNKVITFDEEEQIGNRGTVVRVGSLLNF